MVPGAAIHQRARNPTSKIGPKSCNSCTSVRSGCESVCFAIHLRVIPRQDSNRTCNGYICLRMGCWLCAVLFGSGATSGCADVGFCLALFVSGVTSLIPNSSSLIFWTTAHNISHLEAGNADLCGKDGRSED